MARKSPIGALSTLSAPALGVFRGREAVSFGVTRNQLAALARDGVIEREFPDTYRMTAVSRSNEQRLRAALLWAGDAAAAAGRSAGEVYGLEGVHAPVPEIAVRTARRVRYDGVHVRRGANPAAVRGRPTAAAHVDSRAQRVPRSVRALGPPRRQLAQEPARGARSRAPGCVDA
jgi:hypothetical protein